MNGGLIAAGLLGAYALYRGTQGLQSLDYQVEGVRVHKATLTNMQVAVNLKFLNPSPLQIDIDGLFLKIMQSGDTLGTATRNNPLSVKPRASSSYEVLVDVPYSSLTKAKLENGAYNLTLNGTITPKGLGSIYIDRPVTIPVGNTLATLLSKISSAEGVNGIEGPATRLLKQWRNITPEQRAKWDAKWAERKARRAQRLAANPFRKRRPHAMAAG